MEPRASPSGCTWQATATEPAPRSTSRARSNSLIPSALACPRSRVLVRLHRLEDLLEPDGGADGLVGAELQLGRVLQAGLRADGRLQPLAVLAERLEDGVVVGVEVGELHDRPAEVGVHGDVGDGHELEAGVVEPLELVGHDLAAQLVYAGHAGVAPGAPVAVARAAGHQPSPGSSQVRVPSSTCTSGCDHTNRSTSSRMSHA